MILIETLLGKQTVKTPVWLMRQAGRYLPEYRQLREKAGSFLTMCYTPDLATEITLQPLRRFDLDAAIIFSDILVIPHALGQDLKFVHGEGPQLPPLPQEKWNIAFDPTGFKNFLKPVYQAIQQTRQEMPKEKALIGFAGAPWTLACYMLQGHGGTGFKDALILAQEYPQKFKKLMQVLTESVALHLIQQIDAGCNAVQVFDSWAGLCPAEKITEYIIQPMNAITQLIKTAHPQIPIIGFPRGLGKDYPRYAAETTMQGLGVDQGEDLSALVKNIARPICLQGNLDPELLLRGGNEMQNAVTHILKTMQGRSHVFNLGHGVIKETPPEHVQQLIEQIKG
jgi:uroporphyrinogen decarboxylase